MGQGLIAVFVGLLSWVIKSWLAEMKGEVAMIRAEMKEQRKAYDRNTKMVTIAFLQLTALLPGVRGQLDGIKKEIEEQEAADERTK